MSVVKVALSPKALGCLKKLKSLNLWPIAAYLMEPKKGYSWTLPQAFHAIERYKTFLFVSYLYPDVLLIPTLEIDQVWHIHILHTRQYRKDCEMLFGHFIDHEPASEVWSESKKQNFDEAFAQTQALLALFEGYFTQADLGETNLHQTDKSKSTENQLQVRSDGDKRNLLLCPSACGRLP